MRRRSSLRLSVTEYERQEAEDIALAEDKRDGYPVEKEMERMDREAAKKQNERHAAEQESKKFPSPPPKNHGRTRP